MNPRVWLLVLLVLLAGASGCGSSEGGIVGSGITAATVSGNVIEVSEGASPARLLVPRVRVRIEEAADLATLTGDDGAFELRGDFAGPVTLRFENPGGRLLGRLPIDVPAGSTVVLENLEIRPNLPGGVRAGEIRQRNLFGRLVTVDCAMQRFVVDDDVSRPFRVQLLPATVIVRRDGTPAGCADLRRGGVVLVEGLVLAEQGAPLIRAARVTLAPERPPRSDRGAGPSPR